MLTEMIATWRTEIETDLAEAENELANEREALVAAEAAATEAKRERRELTEALGRLHHSASLASSVALRVRFHEDTLRQVDGRVVQSRNAAKGLHARIADLRAGLTQLDVIVPPPAIEIEADAA